MNNDNYRLCEDGLLTVAEASTFLRISVQQLYQLMNRGELKSVRIERSRRLPKRELVRFAGDRVEFSSEKSMAGGHQAESASANCSTSDVSIMRR